MTSKELIKYVNLHVRKINKCKQILLCQTIIIHRHFHV